MKVYLEKQGNNIGVKTVHDNGKVTRRIVTPGVWQNGGWVETDLSGESADVRALAAKLWTDDVKAGARAFAEAQFAGPEFQPLTPRQIRLAMLSAGITEAMVDSALAGNAAGMIEWKHANVFKRDHELIAAMAVNFNLTADQVDALWREAARL